MNKFFCLTSIAILCSCASFAQQANDIAGDKNIFSDFSCILKNTNSVLLQWKADNIGEGDYFIIERSTDGSNYETVSALKITDTASGYAITDNSPHNGSDFYRIKYISKSGKFIYSKIKQVELFGAVDFKFYPNPVDKLLIIQTSHSIDIQVLDAAGGLRLAKQLQPGLQIINISLLERGTYILKVEDKQSNKVISEQLLKN